MYCSSENRVIGSKVESSLDQTFVEQLGVQIKGPRTQPTKGLWSANEEKKISARLKVCSRGSLTKDVRGSQSRSARIKRRAGQKMWAKDAWSKKCGKRMHGSINSRTSRGLRGSINSLFNKFADQQIQKRSGSISEARIKVHANF